MWNPEIGDTFQCEKEGNAHDRYAAAVKLILEGEYKLGGHIISREISRISSLFLTMEGLFQTKLMAEGGNCDELALL